MVGLWTYPLWLVACLVATKLSDNGDEVDQNKTKLSLETLYFSFLVDSAGLVLGNNCVCSVAYLYAYSECASIFRW